MPKQEREYLPLEDVYIKFKHLFKSSVIKKYKINKYTVLIEREVLNRSDSVSNFLAQSQSTNLATNVNRMLDDEDGARLSRNIQSNLSLFRQLSRVIIYKMTVSRKVSLLKPIVKSHIMVQDCTLNQRFKFNRIFRSLKDAINNEIHLQRKSLKKLKEETRTFKNEYLSYKRIGQVMSEPGIFLKLQKKMKIASIFIDKKPKSELNHIGVELEFCSKLDRDKLAEKMYEANLISYCAWHDDQSLRPKEGEHRHELSILAQEHEVYEVVFKICKVLNDCEAISDDRRCGLHIHFDMRQRNKEIVFSNLVACQRWLIKMVPPDRQDGEFCKRVKSRKFPKKFNGTREERYKTINAAAFYRHKTLEIRLHEGTVDAKLISNWIMFLLKIVNHKSELKESIGTLKRLFKVFRMNKHLQIYVKDRINYQKINNPQARPTLTLRERILGGAVETTRVNDFAYTMDEPMEQRDEGGRVMPNRPPTFVDQPFLGRDTTLAVPNQNRFRIEIGQDEAPANIHPLDVTFEIDNEVRDTVEELARPVIRGAR